MINNNNKEVDKMSRDNESPRLRLLSLINMLGRRCEGIDNASYSEELTEFKKRYKDLMIWAKAKNNKWESYLNSNSHQGRYVSKQIKQVNDRIELEYKQIDADKRNKIAELDQAYEIGGDPENLLSHSNASVPLSELNIHQSIEQEDGPQVSPPVSPCPDRNPF